MSAEQRRQSQAAAVAAVSAISALAQLKGRRHARCKDSLPATGHPTVAVADKV
jgi:hypothetical protein